MPATTLGRLQSLLATAQGSSNSGYYLEPGAVFISAVNEIGPRIYNSGMWKDLVTERVYDGSPGYVSLDRDVEAVLLATVNGGPRRVYSHAHDLRVLGNTPFLPERYGLVDAGMQPTKQELPTIQNVDSYDDAAPISTLHLYDATGTAVSLTDLAGGVVSVVGVTPTGEFVASTQGGTTAVTLSFATPVLYFQEVTGEGLPFTVSLRATAGDADSSIAEVLPGYDVVRYRRFRVGGSRDSTYAHCLVKLAWLPVTANSDVIYLGNIPAWKHALLGKLAEDNADVERAEYHWGKVRQMLEEEIEASRGAAIPQLNIDISRGCATPIHSQY